MALKMYHVLFIAFLLVFTAAKSTNTGSVNQNFDLKAFEGNIITPPRHDTMITCEGQSFRSIGLLATGGPCETTEECIKYWPSGPSFEFRDRSVCCVAVGECGEFK